MQFAPLVLAHTLAALVALATGGAVLLMKKGTPAHRRLGRTWVALMLAVALSSFGIRTTGHFSWIHLLSLWVLFVLGMAVRSALKRNIRAHRRWIIGAYAGLAVAGIFTLLPHRLLGQLAWHSLGLV